jgi:hypothetical protein
MTKPHEQIEEAALLIASELELDIDESFGDSDAANYFGAFVFK